MQEKKELYQRENGEWALYPYKITCTDRRLQEQKYTDDISYYETYEELYNDFTIDEVKQLAYSDEQRERLSEVQGFKYKDFDEIYDYVINGDVKEDSVIFAIKNVAKLKAENDLLEGTVMELTNILATLMI